MPRIPDSSLAAIKAAVPIPRLLESRGIAGRREGADWVCACPIPSHADQTPSFHVTELDGSSVGHCFGCGWSGNVFQLAQALDGGDFVAAVRAVASVGGLALAALVAAPAASAASAASPGAPATSRPVPRSARPAAPAEACPLDPSARGAALEDQVLAFAHAELIRPGSAGQVYLQSRGVWDPATAARFRLGFLPAGKLGRLLRDHRLDKLRIAGRELRGELTRLGWWSEKTGHATMDGRVVVPIPFLAAGSGFAAAAALAGGEAGAPAACGSVATVYGRAVNKLGHGAPDHKNLSDRPVAGVWNGSDWVDADGAAVLAEAPLDALSLYVAGIRNVSCTLGVGNWTEDHLTALRAGRARDVFLAFDNDEAGNNAVPDLADLLILHGFSAYRVLLPPGQDLNNVARTADTDAPAVLAQLVRDSVWLGGVPRVTVPALPPDTDRDAPRRATAVAALGESAAPAPAGAATSFLAAKPPPAVPAATSALASVAALPAAALPSSALLNSPAVLAATVAPSTPAGAAPPLPAAAAAGAVRRAARALVPQGADLYCILDAGRAYRIRGLPERPQVAMKVALRLLLPAAGDGPEPATWSGPSSMTCQADLTLVSSREKFAEEAGPQTGLAEAVILRDLGQVLDACEAWQDESTRAAEAAAATRGGGAGAGSSRPVIASSPEADAAGRAFLLHPEPLRVVDADLTARGLVGETINKVTCYLAATSRILARPLAVLIQSSSAAGKTTLMDAILDLMPEECRKRTSAISEMALYYEKDGLVHTILAIAEEEGAASASYSLKLLQSDGSLTFTRPIKDPETGEMVTRTFRVEGPVQLIVTTTKPLPDDEWANRCLVLTVGETAAQTAAIHAVQRQKQSWTGHEAAAAKAAILAKHHAAQRLLVAYPVHNPYVEQLRFTANHVRARRDFPKYLELIAIITLLHQQQRQREKRLIGGQWIEVVVSTLYDIAVANILADVVLGQSVSELSAPTQGFLAELDGILDTWAAAQGIPRAKLAFSRSQILTATARSSASVKRFLAELVDQEWLTMDRASVTHPARYVAQFSSGAPARAKVCLGLTPVSELDPTYVCDLSWLTT